MSLGSLGSLQTGHIASSAASQLSVHQVGNRRTDLALGGLPLYANSAVCHPLSSAKTRSLVPVFSILKVYGDGGGPASGGGTATTPPSGTPAPTAGPPPPPPTSGSPPVDSPISPVSVPVPGPSGPFF